jgi:SET domain-containing protein
MYLKWISTDVGYGVFAQKNIAEDDFIGVYAGELRLIRNRSNQKHEDVDYAWYYPINVQSY